MNFCPICKSSWAGNVGHSCVANDPKPQVNHILRLERAALHSRLALAERVIQAARRFHNTGGRHTKNCLAHIGYCTCERDVSEREFEFAIRAYDAETK